MVCRFVALQEEKVGKVIFTMKEPQCSIFLWLLDLCLEVSANSNVNKMTPQNMAIVYG